MNKEFKAGDLVLELRANGIFLDNLKENDNDNYPVVTDHASYQSNGLFSMHYKFPSIFHATPENRQALVTLYGEENVPELPLRGSELTKKLLEKQKYVICWVSDASEEKARLKKSIELVNLFDDSKDYCCFFTEHGIWWQYAVPIDSNGNEIKGLDDE
ncbi:hypothetical protein [Psychrobacter sp. I-STPA6b]|uniref:hypothetical protein n=1 Tax=Psychrobacter sp. I-STPA6b TaxID=2585718 RepID=UPI001D0CC70B|nr:hypothetical protein [Psychrobacter sp. I-STPA6b]